MSSRRQSAVILALVVVTAGGIAIGGHEDQRNGSGKELTPGQVALLSNSLDATALENLRGAVTSSDPMVRTVAARVVAVSKSRALAESVASAWAMEQNGGAAAEQARALLLLRGGSAADSIESRLESEAIARIYAEWIARHQPERMVDVLPKAVGPSPADRASLNDFVLIAIANRPDLADRIIGARLRTATPEQWREFLDRLTINGNNAVQDAAIIDALTYADDGIRSRTVWSIVVRLANGEAVSAALLDGVAGPAEAAESGSATWEQFGREIVTRRHHKRQTPDRSALIATEAAGRQSDATALAQFNELLDSERNALKKALGERYPRDVKQSGFTSPVDAMRTVPTLWPGFLKSVIDASQCRIRDNTPAGIAAVTYRADGTIASIAILGSSLPEGCSEVLTAMVRLTVANASYPPATGKREVLVLLLHSDAIECATRPNPAAHAPRPNATIVPPRKTRDVKPFYPAGAQKRRVQGTVFIESTITTTGCVSAMRLVKSVDPELDLAALVAVAGWRFTPTTADGLPVPVIMTVSVNFLLQ